MGLLVNTTTQGMLAWLSWTLRVGFSFSLSEWMSEELLNLAKMNISVWMKEPHTQDRHTGYKFPNW